MRDIVHASADVCIRTLALFPSQQLVDFIRSVDPATYTSVFKESLDNPCVSHIVRALACDAKSDPTFAEASLASLTKVSRFSMIAAMMPKADKAAVGEILAAVEAAGRDAAPLRKAYKL